MRAYWRTVWVLVERELRAEWRSREVISAMVVFGVLVLLVFNFGFPPGTRQLETLTPGILWSSFLFAGILGLNRSMAQEKEDGCLQGLLSAPTDRSVLYLGKTIANLIFLSVLEVLIVVVYALFFNLDLFQLSGHLIWIIALGSVGFIALGTLFAAISVQTRFQEVLLPLLLIPLLSPVLIGAVKATAAVFVGGSFQTVAFWMKFLVTFDAIFLIGCFLAYEAVIQE